MSSRNYNTLRPSRKSLNVKSNLYSSNYLRYESSEKPNFSNSPQSQVQENGHQFPGDGLPVQVDDTELYQEPSQVSDCAKKTLSKSMAPKMSSHQKRVRRLGTGLSKTKKQRQHISRDLPIDVKSSHSS